MELFHKFFAFAVPGITDAVGPTQGPVGKQSIREDGSLAPSMPPSPRFATTEGVLPDTRKAPGADMDSSAMKNEFMDLLRNIETAILDVDADSEDLTDLEVMDALDNLIRAYVAEGNGRPAPFARVSQLKREVQERVRAVTEWYMGRAEPPQTVSERDRTVFTSADQPNTMEEIVACLRKIRLSVKRWNGSHGRRGYLAYIRNFIM